MANEHTDIKNWLDALHLSEYAELFHKYAAVEDLLYVGEEAIKDVGIQSQGHRAKVISSLRVLRERYEKGRVNGFGWNSVNDKNSSARNSPSTSHPGCQKEAVTSDQIAAQLQLELSSDASDLRSRPWYHGNISRERAESLLTTNGDFLVRDCISQPGDFVLTCRWKDSPLSFIINSTVDHAGLGCLPTVSYQLEADQFPSLQQLIEHHQMTDKPVSLASQAILKRPMLRSLPLSYYDSKYSLPTSPSAVFYRGVPSPSPSPNSSPFVTPLTSPRNSPLVNRRLLIKTNLSCPQAGACEDAGVLLDQPRVNFAPLLTNLPVIDITPPGELPDPWLSSHLSRQNSPSPTVAHARYPSAPARISCCLSDQTELHEPWLPQLGNLSPEDDRTSPPPPKPSRVPKLENHIPSLTCNDTRAAASDTRYKGTYIKDSEHRNDSPNNQNENESFAKRFQDKTCIHSFSDTNFASVSKNQINHDTGQRSPKGHKSRHNHHSICAPLCPLIADVINASSNKTTRAVSRSKSFQSPQVQKDINGNNPEMKYSICKLLQKKMCRQSSPTSPPAASTHSPEGSSKEEPPSDTTTGTSPLLSTVPSHCPSHISVHKFSTHLLPPTFTALDPSLLSHAKQIMFKKTPKAVALHLTQYDLELTKVGGGADLGLGVRSGLELLTLPQGGQLRRDVLDRWQALRLWVEAGLLLCASLGDRAQLLSFWILTSAQLAATSGNLLSFTAIMEALTEPGVSRLTDTWASLRHQHTHSAFAFDTKLRPFYLALNDTSLDPPWQHIAVPYVTPACLLLEQIHFLQDLYWERGLEPAAQTTHVMWNHLELARLNASRWEHHQRTGAAVVDRVDLDSDLAQVLRPEFHILFLWGVAGWRIDPGVRLVKLQQVLNLLSHRCQTNQGV